MMRLLAWPLSLPLVACAALLFEADGLVAPQSSEPKAYNEPGKPPAIAVQSTGASR